MCVLCGSYPLCPYLHLTFSLFLFIFYLFIYFLFIYLFIAIFCTFSLMYEVCVHFCSLLGFLSYPPSLSSPKLLLGHAATAMKGVLPIFF
jgi:hypothetical protein